MGIVYSIICSLTFCCERVLTWFCCACLLITVMFAIVAMGFYGISVGYHFAHNELAIWSRGNVTITKLSEMQTKYIDEKDDMRKLIPNIYGESNERNRIDDKHIQKLIAEMEVQRNAVIRRPAEIDLDPINKSDKKDIHNLLQPQIKMIRILTTTKVSTEEDRQVTEAAEETDNQKLLEVIPLRTTRAKNIIEQIEKFMTVNSSRGI